jgi:4-hydroxybenzoate-CoA ligase
MLEDILRRRPYNAASDFVDANVDRGLGQKIAFTDGVRSLTYGDLQDGSYRFASALRAFGLREENRVILIFHDTVDYPIAFWGTIRAGIIPIPINTLLTAEQYAYLFADSRAVATVVAAPLARTVHSIRARLPHLRVVMVVGATAQDRAELRDVLFFEDVLSETKSQPFTAATASDEVAFWMYTSGSTGDPKAVKHVHTSPMASARLMGQGVIGIRENDVAFSAAKLSFSYGLGNALLFPMSVGASAVLLPERPTPQAVLATIRRHRPTIFYAVPSLYAALLAHPDLGPGAGSDRLRLCISAGEPLPASLGERWQAIAGVDILDGLGSTEMLQTFPARRHPLRIDRQAGAGIRGEDRRRKRAAASRRRDRRACGARADRRGRLLESARKEPPHLRRRMDLYGRQICLRPGRLLSLLRAHRRHVQGQWNVGVAIRGRSYPPLARSRARGGGHRQTGRRWSDEAEGLHCAQKRLLRR